MKKAMAVMAIVAGMACGGCDNPFGSTKDEARPDLLNQPTGEGSVTMNVPGSYNNIDVHVGDRTSGKE